MIWSYKKNGFLYVKKNGLGLHMTPQKLSELVKNPFRLKFENVKQSNIEIVEVFIILQKKFIL